ncbi:hypothetical protein T265_14859 [Opisthorchis viverrini]|uniref:Peptidase C13 family protein n=1 Tax=Opisthorchis viverrini TaxID=6198 RepID=A0A074ZA26_OPIVI|nr:hypothetical protein T265_14859 [Opisthorchis viverrini]KER22437.1 hypothetical protein T265_14859 [Opisthorchis viverrini]
MRHCSLLVEFLFCIDYLACLEAVGVHNWSSLCNNKPSKNWVVLVAGSNTWENYQHQADVFHAYQVVRKNKVPPENIITFAYDDIANNPKCLAAMLHEGRTNAGVLPGFSSLDRRGWEAKVGLEPRNSRNPFKGKVFHDYEHEDVYMGVVIDYRGKDVKRDIFLDVLKGDKKLEKTGKKVLKSGRDDNVFIFYSGHGGISLITFLEEDLYATELNDTLAYMYSKKKYNKLVLYVDACYSGSMFEDVLPTNMGSKWRKNCFRWLWCRSC